MREPGRPGWGKSMGEGVEAGSVQGVWGVQMGATKASAEEGVEARNGLWIQTLFTFKSPPPREVTLS